MKMTIFNIYTLEEVIKANRIVGTNYESVYDEIALNEIYADTYDFPITDNPIYDALTNDYIKKLFRWYLLPNYYNFGVLEVEQLSNDDTLTEAQSKVFWIKLFNWLYDTLQVYKPLIDIQEEQLTKAKLLAKVSSQSETRFNDTPQESGNFEDLDHESNYTRYNTEADTLTPIMKIKEIQDNIINIYNKWCREFNKFVIQY